MKFASVLIILISFKVWAIDCQLSKLMAHPSLAENDQFWMALGKIDSHNDRAVRELIQKFSPEVLQTSGAVTHSVKQVSNIAIEVAKKADKDLKKLSQINKKHYDEFLKTINEGGMQELYNNPGKWHYEKLKMDNSLHTVRLNDGVRVLFKEENGVISVLEIGSHVTH